MKGCFRFVVALVLIALAAGLWYFYKKSERSSSSARDSSILVATKEWQPLTPEDAEHGRQKVQSLAQQSGPVFANLTPAEAASYIFLVVAKQLPQSARNVEASIKGDRLYVRSEVDLKDFGGAGSLGALGALLGDRDSVRLGGSIKMLRPGVAEFQVRELKLGRLDVPSALIPRLLNEMKKHNKPVEGVSNTGLPMVMPSYISDVRIADGKITLYKSVQ
jgi:hypothetical protein